MSTPPISRYPVPELKDIPEDIRTRILAVQEKSGFVPNVFFALAHRPAEFRAFFAYHDALMEKEGGLSKAEREMIVVATSNANQCQYCVVAHGAILRIRAKNPLVADQVAVNHRKADITPKQKRHAGFRHEGLPEVGRDRRCRLRDAARPRLRRRGHLGHRRHRRLLRPLESHGQPDRHAPER
jgi:AhpD family alkylhydroperoxidase